MAEFKVSNTDRPVIITKVLQLEHGEHLVSPLHAWDNWFVIFYFQKWWMQYKPDAFWICYLKMLMC